MRSARDVSCLARSKEIKREKAKRARTSATSSLN